MSLYRQLQRLCTEKEELDRVEKASFVVRAIGCAGLADIYPLKLSPAATKAENQKVYDRWRRKIAYALESYGDFGTLQDRSAIATDLLVHMALCVKRGNYVLARNLLLRKE
jgi:hypothetical protein